MFLDVNLIIWLVIAHYVGDFVFQNRFMAEFKGKYFQVMLAHGVTWAAPICVVLEIFGHGISPAAVISLVFGHMAIDYMKCQWNEASRKGALTYKLWVDQILHFIQLGVIYVIG